ncbi:MAG: LysM peptidoglycan-binding domain-containing protein [Eubacteriales bacterium]|nr:LysM peptidoglycan-binding domain-containing protein [Eubacteriales bacterium]
MEDILTVYRMRRYDRLETLSAHFGVPVCMIMRANAFRNAEDIISCKEIKIPKKCYCLRCAADKITTAGARYETYTVQPEDTIYGIAKRCGLTMRIIQKANGIDDAAMIRAGDRLLIPAISGERYCIREGESLEDIALARSISVDSIMEKNFIGPAEAVHAGMQLILG